MADILRYSTEIGRFGSQLCQSRKKIDPHCPREKYSPKNLVFINIIWFMPIFAEVADNQRINERCQRQ